MAILVDLPMSGPDGSNVFTDNTGRTWTAQGNARISGNALLLQASGDNIRTPGGGLENLYSGFTSIEFEVRTTNTTASEQILVDYYSSGTGLRWQLSIYGGKFHNYNSSNGRYLTGTTNILDGNWHKLRMEVAGTSKKLYVDDVLEASGTSTQGDASAPYLTLGTEGSASTQFVGSMRNLKITQPDPASPLTHSPWIRRSYVGWDNTKKVPTVKEWELYRHPEARIMVPRQFRLTRGVPPWWGAAGSTTQLPTYKIRGRVMIRDEVTGEDTPLPNIRVALFFRRLHTLIDIQLSDANGYVQFDNLMPGVQAYYGIAFDKDGTPLHNSVLWDRLSSEPGP
ncbi:tail fiber [Stenotrophomonas phage Suzuki]|nr:tail fiber [Stenotrophomonas phage Suzuki]